MDLKIKSSYNKVNYSLRSTLTMNLKLLFVLFITLLFSPRGTQTSSPAIQKSFWAKSACFLANLSPKQKLVLVCAGLFIFFAVKKIISHFGSKDSQKLEKNIEKIDDKIDDKIKRNEQFRKGLGQRLDAIDTALGNATIRREKIKNAEPENLASTNNKQSNQIVQTIYVEAQERQSYLENKEVSFRINQKVFEGKIIALQSGFTFVQTEQGKLMQFEEFNFIYTIQCQTDTLFPENQMLKCDGHFIPASLYRK